MKLTMSHVLKGLAGLAICSAIMILSREPAQAILEGSNRDRLEYLEFSESLIKDSLYAKRGRNTFNNDQKKFVRGVKRHNEPRIYEPDVYTWELAMNEHRSKLQIMNPTPDLPPARVNPAPMYQDSILPSNPAPYMVKNPRDCRANDIKRRVLQHMNYMDSRQLYTIPALQPAVYPRGRHGDSFDANF